MKIYIHVYMALYIEKNKHKATKSKVNENRGAHKIFEAAH